MPDSTLSALTAASALTGAELLYVVQGGADRKATQAQVVNQGASANWFGYQAALLDPGAIEPFQQSTFTYTVAANATKVMLASWQTRLGSGGRLEVRNPAFPMFLRGVTVTGLLTDSTGIFLDPTLPVDTAPFDTYNARRYALANSQVQYLPITAASSDTVFLPGPYGIIMTRAVNFDAAWIVFRYNQLYGINLNNEINDAQAQRNDAGLLLPLSKSVCNSIGLGAGSGSSLGGVAYVILPSTWSKVADPLSPYTFRDDFMGAAIDTATVWSRTQSGAGILEIYTPFAWLKCVGGAGAWGINGMRSQTTLTRSNTKVLTFDFYNQGSGAGQILLGWNNTAGIADTNMSHAVYCNGTSATIVENGTSRGGGGTIAASTTYRFRLSLDQPTSGKCKYEVQGGAFGALGSASWTDITPGTTTSADTTLAAGMAMFGTGPVYVGDMRIYG